MIKVLGKTRREEDQEKEGVEHKSSKKEEIEE